MSSTTLERPVSEKEKVYTADELKALRRRLAERGSTTGRGTDAPTDEQKPQPADWESDRDLLIKFLQDLDKIMRMLIDVRIPDPTRRLLQDSMEVNRPSLEEAIETLGKIDSEEHETYGALKRVGLAFENLMAKLDGFRDDIMGRPVEALLDSANKILGSLCKVISVLEPVKEMKEQIEHRIKYGPDDQILGLGLYRS